MHVKWGVWRAFSHALHLSTHACVALGNEASEVQAGRAFRDGGLYVALPVAVAEGCLQEKEYIWPLGKSSKQTMQVAGGVKS